jgi:hypothetical protein
VPFQEFRQIMDKGSYICLDTVGMIDLFPGSAEARIARVAAWRVS